MGNDRNTSALVQVLTGAPGLPTGIPPEALAEHLAAARVPYPVALTDDEAVKIGADAAGVFLRNPARSRSVCARGSSASPVGSVGAWEVADICTTGEFDPVLPLSSPQAHTGLS
jgi:hypothetical protein